MDNLTLFGLASGAISGAAFIFIIVRLAARSKRWPFRILLVLLALWWAVIFVACVNAIWQCYVQVYL